MESRQTSLFDSPHDSSRGHATAPEARADFQRALSAAFDIRFAMVSMPAAHVSPRPMTTQRLDDDERLWFFAAAGSDLVRALSKDNRLLLTYASPADQRYVTIEGTGVVLRDETLTRAMWSSMDHAFFPGGPNDAALRLLCVNPRRIEEWASDGTRIGQYARLLAAAAGLTEPHADTRGRHTVLQRPD